MKRYCSGFILLLVVLFLTESVNAQNDSSYYKYSIKTNALQWIVNEANVVFEYRFSRKFGLEGTLGTYGVVHVLSNDDFDMLHPFIPNKGLTIRINPKFYVLPEKSTQSPAVYVSPMLLLKNNTIDWVEQRKVAGASLLLGVQQNFSNHFLADFYIGGGIRYRAVSMSAKENAPSMHLGIKLGYLFKPVKYSSKDIKPAMPVINYKYVVKTSILPFLANQQNIGFEYRFSKLLGLEASAGTYSLFGNKNYNKHLPALAYDSSYTFKLNPKVYFHIPLRSGSLPFYISPMYTRNYFEYGETAAHESWNYVKVKDDIGSLLLGYQRNFYKHIIADFFMGVGHKYTYNTIILNQRPNPTAEPVMYKSSYREQQTVFHFGIKLGYGFKSI